MIIGIVIGVATIVAIIGLAFSVFVSIISGIVPARTAARMNPVDALRFEQ